MAVWRDRDVFLLIAQGLLLYGVPSRNLLVQDRHFVLPADLLTLEVLR